MLELYGIDGRSFRCAWMLEELGLRYERVPIRFATDARSEEFLNLNPNGKIPVLRDGELVLFESLAINLHLARKYGGALWPDALEDQSRVVQWLAWALAELEGPHDSANRGEIELDGARLQKSLQALRVVLEDSDYLLGHVFTVADLNTAAVLLRPQYRPVALADGVIGSWFKRCTAREALRRL